MKLELTEFQLEVLKYALTDSYIRLGFIARNQWEEKKTKQIARKFRVSMRNIAKKIGYQMGQY